MNKEHACFMIIQSLSVFDNFHHLIFRRFELCSHNNKITSFVSDFSASNIPTKISKLCSNVGRHVLMFICNIFKQRANILQRFRSQIFENFPHSGSTPTTLTQVSFSTYTNPNDTCRGNKSSICLQTPNNTCRRNNSTCLFGLASNDGHSIFFLFTIISRPFLFIVAGFLLTLNLC